MLTRQQIIPQVFDEVDSVVFDEVSTVLFGYPYSQRIVVSHILCKQAVESRDVARLIVRNHHSYSEADILEILDALFYLSFQ